MQKEVNSDLLGKVEANKAEVEKKETSAEHGSTKRALMRNLSENSRASVTTLATKLNCSRNTIINNMKSLEKEFDLKYTIEFNKHALGFLQKHILKINLAILPSAEELRKIFKDDNHVHFAAITQGEFDLVLDMVTDSSEEYVQWGVNTLMKLLPYKPTIEPSMVGLVHIGFIGIPNETLNSIDLERFGLDTLDKQMLMLLNENSRLGYRALARKLGENVEIVRYRMKKLYKSKIVKRFTIIAQKPPTNFNVAFFADFEFAPGMQERYKMAKQHYVQIDGAMPMVNTFQFVSLVSGSYVFFGLACFENEEKAIKETLIALREIYREDHPVIRFAKIVEVIKGSLPVRNIDIQKEYAPITWD